jgi:hypothetical protein
MGNFSVDIRTYTSIVDYVIISALLLTASVKPPERKPTKIELKILKSVASDGFGNEIILKCLVNLYEIGLRPPPGGAEQHKSVVFSINF